MARWRQHPILLLTMAAMSHLSSASPADPRAAPHIGQVTYVTRCDHLQSTPVYDGRYRAQNNEWGSTAPECIAANTSGTNFVVTSSSISEPTNATPGGYPSIYQGCHYGLCTSNSGLPIQAANLTPGTVTTSWYTAEPHTGAYDIAYDIRFNQTPSTARAPNGPEIMVWLDHNGPVEPAGSIVATNVTISGYTFNVWYRPHSGGSDITYELTTPRTFVTNLDVGRIAADSIARGYLPRTDYLIDVEAGFELWIGGTGLATKAFAVNVAGHHLGGTAPDTPQPEPLAGR